MARDFDAAKARVGERLKSRKPTAELQVLAARVYAASGQLETVEAYLRGAIEMKPTLLTAYEMLGELYLSQGKLDQARQEFDNLAERQSTPVAPLTMSGIILQTQGHMGEARKRFERALASDPRAGIAANNLAWLYVESGESLDMALRFSQTAVAAMPETPEVLDTLGWIYYKKNLPALAVPPLRQSVEKQPGNPVYEYHLGLAQLQGSDVVAGRQSLERALQLSASFAGADNARLVLAQLDARR
jgi:Tfp pilus assembly protein PilF